MARNPSRRDFIIGSLALGLAPTARAIEPIRRQGPPLLKLSLAAYSYRQALDLRQREPALTLETFIDRAATLPFDAVELTGYYFPRTTPEYLARLRGRCTRLGLDISGTAIRNDFCLTNAERRQAQIAHVKQWVEHTSRLGGKTLRIFAGNVERGDAEDAARCRVVDAIEEVCEHASQFGVLIALENHGGITATCDQLLALVRAVRSEWFGVNLDTRNFRSEDPYADIARVAPYAVVVQMKTDLQRGDAAPEDADFPRLLRILRDANFRGYVTLEYEAAEDPNLAIPRHARTLRGILSASGGSASQDSP